MPRMPTPHPRIFLGSSLEAIVQVDDIAQCLRTVGAEVLPWGDPRVFQGGKTYIESLEAIMRQCDAPLLIAGSDDEVQKRGVTDRQPRDNVILEYGMAIMAFGRERTALAVIGHPKLPTDLLGVKPLALPDCGDPGTFRQGIKVPLREWCEQLQRTPPKLTLHTDLPNLAKRIVDILGQAGDTNRHRLDLAASDLIEWLALSFEPEKYSMDTLAEMRPTSCGIAMDSLPWTSWARKHG